MESQKEKKRSDPEAVQRLETKQRQQAARSLRTDFAGAQKTTYEQVENNPDKPPWWNVDSYIEALEKLGQHDAMHFFDINQKETVRTTKKIRLNPMLPPLIESIVKSAQVKPSVKLPLAIRLDDDNDVKTLCDAHGIAMGRAQNELSSDSRLLLFAAFHDQGKVVERLLDTGFELHQIDILVALEIQRALDKPHLVKEDSAPDWWVRSQFQAGADPDLVRTRWRKVGVEEKDRIYRSISWEMMSGLPGWNWMAETLSPEGWWPHAMVMQQVSCAYLEDEYPPHGLMKRKFIVVSPPKMAGQTFEGKDESVHSNGILRCVSAALSQHLSPCMCPNRLHCSLPFPSGNSHCIGRKLPVLQPLPLPRHHRRTSLTSWSPGACSRTAAESRRGPMTPPRRCALS